MASISTSSNGHRAIQFMDAGKRRTIRLGKATARDAEEVKTRVERLLACKLTNLSPDAETAKWLARLDRVFRQRLEAAGLVAHVGDGGQADAPKLKDFLDRYRELRTDVKPGTKTNYDQTKRFLLGFFGEEKRLADINEGDAEEYRLHLGRQLHDNTARRHAGRAKQFFAFAVRKGWIAKNPFAVLRACSVRSNEAREYFVTLEETQAVLEACPEPRMAAHRGSGAVWGPPLPVRGHAAQMG